MQQRHPNCIATYRRRMPVSLKRMFENALDWEHLPHLHSGSFSSIDCRASGQWGWRATAQLAKPDPAQMPSAQAWRTAFTRAALREPLALARYSATLASQTRAIARGSEVELELRLDKAAKSWTTTTLRGPGVGSQIVTHVEEFGEHDIEVTVQFVIPDVPTALQHPIGQYYQALYAVLYDEDQHMMSERQQALDVINQRQKSAKLSAEPISLGHLKKLRSELPKTVSHGGSDWQVAEVGKTLVAYSTLCPHMLGPLGESLLENGIVECPWHGYRFDVQTGKQLGGNCKLAVAPAITITEHDDVILG